MACVVLKAVLAVTRYSSGTLHNPMDLNDHTTTSNPTGALVVVERSGGPAYEAKWRCRGRQVKRRVGPAWLEREAPNEDWRPRRGRMPEGYLDEKRATVRMAELIAEHEQREREIEAGQRGRQGRG